MQHVVCICLCLCLCIIEHECFLLWHLFYFFFYFFTLLLPLPFNNLGFYLLPALRFLYLGRNTTWNRRKRNIPSTFDVMIFNAIILQPWPLAESSSSVECLFQSSLNFFLFLLLLLFSCYSFVVTSIYLNGSFGVSAFAVQCYVTLLLLLEFY